LTSINEIEQDTGQAKEREFSEETAREIDRAATLDWRSASAFSARADLPIPVWHDDQQGTAAVVLAALLNALESVGPSRS
jgi:malic enzyme